MPLTKEEVILILGGNQRKRIALIKEAITLLQKNIGSFISSSSLYETTPWGFEADQNFLNQVVVFQTSLTPEQVLDQCQNIEKVLGRHRTDGKGYESRTMDIDILFYGDQVINTPRLIVPHPRIHLRNFVLVPLAEVAPNKVHPTLKKKIKELLNASPDNEKVHKL